MTLFHRLTLLIGIPLAASAADIRLMRKEPAVELWAKPLRLEKLSDETEPEDKFTELPADADKNFTALLADLSNRDYHARKSASKELLAKLKDTDVIVRKAYLHASVAADVQTTTSPEAQMRLEAAIASAGLSLPALQWQKLYCHFLEEEKKKAKAVAKAFDLVAQAFADLRQFRSSPTRFHEIAKRKLEAAKFEVAPLEKGALVNSYEFNVVHGKEKLIVQVLPTPARRGNVIPIPLIAPTLGQLNFFPEEALIVNVFAAPVEKTKEIPFEQLLEPALAARYNFSKIPKMKVPYLGVGGLIILDGALSWVRNKALVPYLHQIAHPEKDKMGKYAKAYLQALQPQLYWSEREHYRNLKEFSDAVTERFATLMRPECEEAIESFAFRLTKTGVEPLLLSQADLQKLWFQFLYGRRP